MLNLLASLYVEMGKNDKVEGLLQEALRIYEKKFGPNHP
ncbi:MAG: tetratricopeptide repeat protein, partial [Microscillaceae bacterium]|nr:tetratricopeptide repeat protein [Microscillaceae bacterium]